MKTIWRCYKPGKKDSRPLLVLNKQPEVFIVLKRFPILGNVFRWNETRWRIREIEEGYEDDFGPFVALEAIESTPNEFIECPECGGIMFCAETCWKQFHKNDSRVSTKEEREKKTRPGTLDAPLRKILSRREKKEFLECGHFVKYSEFKYIDVSAERRRCLACCPQCPPRKPHARLKGRNAHPF